MSLQGQANSPEYLGDVPHNFSAEVRALPRGDHEVDPMLKGGLSSDLEIPNKPAHQLTRGRDQSVGKFNFFWNWKWELLSLVGTTMALISIIIILNHYHGRPSPNWPYEITLNTLVSIFSTVLKALMMMAVAECSSSFQICQSNPTDKNYRH